jgi:hypothetical protein
MECTSTVRATEAGFTLREGFRLLPMAHCHRISVEQDGKVTVLLSW